MTGAHGDTFDSGKLADYALAPGVPVEVDTLDAETRAEWGYSQIERRRTVLV
jgi:hypothetical protein